MRRGWLILLLALWAPAVLPQLVSAQTPQQPPQTTPPQASQPQPNSTPPVTKTEEKQTDNTAAILSAIAALITAAAGVITSLKISKNTMANVKLEQEKFKEQFQSELLKNLSLFEQVMRLVLTDKSESEDIWLLFGGRLVSNIEFEKELEKYEERLGKAEEELLRLSASVYILAPLLTDERVKKRLEEQAQKLLESPTNYKNLKGGN